MAREVKVAVVGDARQLQKELQKAEKAVAGFGKNAKDSSEQLKNVFIGSAVAFGAKQIIDSAAQLEAAVGGTAAVFTTASGEIDKFARAAATTSGLSEKAARDITSKLGSSLQGAGMDAEAAAKQAIMLTQTGADLAATLGGSTEEAVSALGGALRGEYDPLERFGIALTANQVNAQAVAMGLADSESSVSAYAKQQATLALLTERSAFAQGTFAKEAGTAEGAAKIAGARLQNTSADIGKSFLPIYTKVAEIVGKVAEAFGALPGPVQTGVIGIGAAAAIGPKIVDGVKSGIDALKSIPGTIDKVVDKLTSSKGMFDGFATTTEQAGTKAKGAAGASGIGALGPALFGATAVIGLAAFAWQNYNQRQEDARNRAKEFLDTLDQSNGALTSQTDSLIQNTLESRNQIDNLNEAGVSLSDFKKAITDTSGSLSDANLITALANRNLKEGAIGRDATIAGLKGEDSARSNLIATLAEQGVLDEGLVKTIVEQANAYEASLKVIEDRAIAAATLAGADKDQAAAAGAAARANAENAAKIKETYDNTLALLNSDIAAQQARIAAQKAVEEYNKSLSDGSLSARDREEKELALRSQLLNTAAAAAKAAEDQAALEGKTLSAKDAAIIQRDKLIELAGTVAPGSGVQTGLQEMIDKLQGVIDRRVLDVKIFLDKYQAIAAIEDVNVRIAAMKGLAYSPGSRDYSSLGVPPRAVGGPVNANSPYLVGERGPELFVPTGYGRIIDNMATMSTLTGGTPVGVGGGTVNVTINMAPGANGDDVVDAIRRYERRNGPIFQSA
jgi:hypothetical protein